MLTQVENTPHGYIVSAYIQDDGGCWHWVRLKNFGDRQGDAKAFREYDLPRMELKRILLFAKQFQINKKYERICNGRYRITMEK